MTNGDLSKERGGKGWFKLIGTIILAAGAFLGYVGTIVFESIVGEVAKQEAMAFLEPYLIMTKDRQDAIKGNWHGTIEQDAVTAQSQSDKNSKKNDLRKFDIDFTFKPGHQRIGGDITLKSPIDNRIRHFKLSGGFLHDRYLQLEYKTDDASSVTFGSAVLELDLKGQTLKGRFVGIGDESNGFVTGHVSLIRQPG